MIELLETVNEASVVVLALCAFFYSRHLKKLKWERKLTTFQFIMYIVSSTAYFFWAVTFLLLVLGV